MTSWYNNDKNGQITNAILTESDDIIDLSQKHEQLVADYRLLEDKSQEMLSKMREKDMAIEELNRKIEMLADIKKQ